MFIKFLNKFFKKIIRIIKFSVNEFYKKKKINYRIFNDKSNDALKISLSPGRKQDWAIPTIFNITYKDQKLIKEVYYSSLTLFSLLKRDFYNFQTVLDIGSHSGNCSDIFKFLGKDVTRCEHLELFEAEYKSDFITTNFNKKFDCIWASQVLEHQRNVGLFLNKCFDDLKDDGILAITVPKRFMTFDLIEFGHCVNFTPLNLIYNLILSGFDCSDIRMKTYEYDGDANIGVILKKKYNKIDRSLSMASVLPMQISKNTEIIMNDKKYDMKDVNQIEIFKDFKNSFPKNLDLDHVTYFHDDNINWKDFI